MNTTHPDPASSPTAEPVAPGSEAACPPHTDGTVGCADAGVDRRPWRLRRPVLAGVVLYGTLVAVAGTIGLLWLRERERGRQDGLLTVVDGLNQTGIALMDPARAARVLEDEVLAKSPDDDVRRRALLLLATAYDAAKRYDDSDRTYGALRREWPAGLATGPLIVPWANMLVTAGRAERARELLAAPGAVEGYGTADEVAAVRARVDAAFDASPRK